MTRWIGVATVAMALAGCGLIDPNVADFDLSLPEKEITIDSAQWQLTSDSTMPAMSCTDQPGVCSAGTSEICGADGVCFGRCDGTNCEVTVLVALWHTFDLATEKPELQEIEGQPLVSVTIDRVYYEVSENTFNVDSPEMTVYVAPQGVMVPGDPQARAIGTIDPVPAGTTVTDGDVTLTPQGQEDLREFMKDYATPFNLILGAELDISAGDAVPQGRMVAVVKVDAHAGI